MWALALQEFNHIVEYRRGSENINGDVLSRKPVEEVNLVCELSPNFDRNKIRDCKNRDPLLKELSAWYRKRRTQTMQQNLFLDDIIKFGTS